MKESTWVSKVIAKGEVDVVTSGGYTYAKVMESRNTSKNPDYWYKIAGENKYLFRSSVAESWEFTLPNEPNPIRNLNQVYLRFLDTSSFTEAADYFKVVGAYTTALKGMPTYNLYWDTQQKYCLYGKVTGGVRISGRHYFMLNFGRMLARVVLPNGKFSKDKAPTFPMLTDHQYYLLNEIEWWYLDKFYTDWNTFSKWWPTKTEEDFEFQVKQIGAVPKARRKGITNVAGTAINAYNMWFVPASYSLIGAYQEDFYSTMLGEVIAPTRSWLNEHTPFIRRSEVLNRKDDFKASYNIKLPSGVTVEKGYKSQISAATFGGTAFKAIGKGAYSVTIEEAGKFNNLLDVLSISVTPLLRDGGVMIGSGIILGTAGEMEDGGGSIALSELSYYPKAYNLAAYENIYEKTRVASESSLFIDALWYYPIEGIRNSEIRALLSDPHELALFDSLPAGFRDAFDTNGNSYRFIARAILEKERVEKQKLSSKAYLKYVTQWPLYLEEAFLVNNSSPFDVPLAKEALATLMTSISGKTEIPWEQGHFIENKDGQVIWVQDFSNKPVLKFPSETDRDEGCWMLFERPVNNPTPNRYIAATDPNEKGYEESTGKSRHSLASTFIMDTFTGNLVAEYTGRTARTEDYFKELFRGLQYYGAKDLFENNLKGLFTYAKEKRKLMWLANEPSILKNKAGYNAGKTGTKGVHIANVIIKNEFLKYIVDWLDEDVEVGSDYDGMPIYTKRYYTIKSPALLMEIERYSSKGNFDRLSALIILMIHYSEIKARSGSYADGTTGAKEDEFAKLIDKRLKYGRRV